MVGGEWRGGQQLGAQVIPEPDSDQLARSIVDRHGIRIIVEQTGRIGAFDFQTTLIQLVRPRAPPGFRARASSARGVCPSLRVTGELVWSPRGRGGDGRLPRAARL